MAHSVNRFDFLRLIFASGVFAYHAVALAALDVGGPWESGLALIAELSIQGFFIVSGALVYGSWLRSKGLVDYASKRARRLYPAYLVIIMVPSLISLLMSLGQAGALQHIGQHLAANLVFLNFLEPNLPGLFAENRFPVVNGALWTLKIEVMFYAALPLLAWGLARMGKFWWLGLAMLALSALIWVRVMEAWDHPLNAQLARQLPGQLIFFAAGMALWKLWSFAERHAFVLLLCGIVLLSLSLTVESLHALRAPGLACVIAGLAFMPGPQLNAARWGDVSYGVYIVHFPVLQTLIVLEIFTRFGALTGLGLAAIIVFGLSYALWWVVEKPALRRDSHYRKVSE